MVDESRRFQVEGYITGTGTISRISESGPGLPPRVGFVLTVLPSSIVTSGDAFERRGCFRNSTHLSRSRLPVLGPRKGIRTPWNPFSNLEENGVKGEYDRSVSLLHTIICTFSKFSFPSQYVSFVRHTCNNRHHSIPWTVS